MRVSMYLPVGIDAFACLLTLRALLGLESNLLAIPHGLLPRRRRHLRLVTLRARRLELVRLCFVGCLARHCEQLSAATVDADLELLIVRPHRHVVLEVARQTHLDHVLAVHRKRTRDAHAAARAERQTVEMLLLRKIIRNPIQLCVRREHRRPDREPAHFLRRGKISFHQRRRHPEYAGHVVESIARIVRRQQRRHIDLHGEQVAYDVLILGAIEPMEEWIPARIRIRRRGTIELTLEPRRKRVVGGPIRTRPADRRHETGAELDDDLLPGRSVRAHVRQRQRVESKSRGFRPLIVTGDAVPIQQLLMRRHF
jgi:hypothetical protein